MLRVIGAGVGRTGTTSLKLALEHVLGGSCYHMYEVLQNRDHVPVWHEAIHGRPPSDWETIYGGFVATVDWPGAAFWRELSEAYPDALVLLSQRPSAKAWFNSADRTINQLMQRKPREPEREWHAMAMELLRTRFTPIPFDREKAQAAYEHHNAMVRTAVEPARLLEWQVGDGWGPICERLGVGQPDIPFPHTNTRDEFETFLENLPEAPAWAARLRSRVGRYVRGRRPRT